MTRVLVFGASITAGFWDPEGGWAHYLAKDLHSRSLKNNENHQLYNLSHSGDTSRDLVKRIGNEIEARYKPEKEYLIIISIGGNDALYFNEEDRNKVPLNEFRENLERIIEISKVYAENVVYVGGVPPNYEKLDPLPWSENESILKQDRQEYLSVAKEVCKSENVPTFMLPEMLEEDFGEHLVDDLHPDTEGHRKIYNKLEPEIEQFL